MKIKPILFLISTLLYLQSFSQSTIHPSSAKYEYPKDKEIAENLENWRDQKFGIIIHWGLYAVPGIIESWSLCDEDWINRDTASNYTEYKKWYWGLNETFNPTRFNPDAWAKMAKNAGMRYVVFTTKHHDGFNMFDTKFSDFKISNGPFKNNPKANVAKEVFSSFRKEGMLIGAYYSKPDWHSQYFWWDRHSTPDRNVNYDIRKYPWRWNQFVQFTHNQIDELTSDYGKIDILWLDGGWVRPRNSVTEEVLSWGAPIPDFDQQIDLPKIAAKVRKNQPGMLIVDRTVHGEFENYRTPEQGIPAKMSSDPWESCITLGGAWSHVPNDHFKTSAWAIHTLIEVVSKGGNLLLGLGPNPQGEFLQIQEERLKEIGEWLDVNGEAIYNTRAIENFSDGEVYFTKGKKQYSYAIQRISEKTPLEQIVSWKGNTPKKGTAISILGQKDNLKWDTKSGKTSVSIPKEIWEKLKNEPAVALKFEH
ncbi:alpha-L-fucosidase [Lacihabitans sp. LS3-19]|uniref:alpha-L-fucosidase n=1 Tax=Lacihabitans sp. LS3-19 TaxID=2487335 RepID=UPI0020CE1DF1|nr:alpha-L-fucosidase [Lacihabitans sp. LS3-19]MCP9766596.1 alpha-L-fucosidase [Lacihabitans sp. LS3-19]